MSSITLYGLLSSAVIGQVIGPDGPKDQDEGDGMGPVPSEGGVYDRFIGECRPDQPTTGIPNEQLASALQSLIETYEATLGEEHREWGPVTVEQNGMQFLIRRVGSAPRGMPFRKDFYIIDNLTRRLRFFATGEMPERIRRGDWREIAVYERHLGFTPQIVTAFLEPDQARVVGPVGRSVIRGRITGLFDPDELFVPASQFREDLADPTGLSMAVFTPSLGAEYGERARVRGTTELLADIERALVTERGNVSHASARINISFLVTDNLTEGAWSNWILRHQERLMSDPALRDFIREASHFAAVEAFSFGYAYADEFSLSWSVRFQLALFLKWDEILQKHQLSSDNFGQASPYLQHMIIREASAAIDEVLQMPVEVGMSLAGIFWDRVKDVAKLVRGRTIEVVKGREGTNVASFYDRMGIQPEIGYFASSLGIHRAHSTPLKVGSEPIPQSHRYKSGIFLDQTNPLSQTFRSDDLINMLNEAELSVAISMTERSIPTQAVWWHKTPSGFLNTESLLLPTVLQTLVLGELVKVGGNSSTPPLAGDPSAAGGSPGSIPPTGRGTLSLPFSSLEAVSVPIGGMNLFPNIEMVGGSLSPLQVRAALMMRTTPALAPGVSGLRNLSFPEATPLPASSNVARVLAR